MSWEQKRCDTMAKPPHTGSEMGVLYLMCWLRHYPQELQSMEGSLPPPLLQNRACHFCGTRLLSDVPSVRGIRLAVADSPDDL